MKLNEAGGLCCVVCSASSDSVPWAAEKTEHDESGSRRSCLVGNCCKGCFEVYLVNRDGTGIFTIDDFVAKTKCKKYLNAVLKAKEVRARTVAKGCADESVQERLGLFHEVTTAFITLTESELRSTSPGASLPLRCPWRPIPHSARPFSFSSTPTDRIGSSPFAHAMAPIASGACWTRGIRSTAARATLC